MKRRQFLQGMALSAAAAACPAVVKAAPSAAPQAQSPQGTAYPNFTFGANGKFRIMQITDTHYIAGDGRSKRALDCVTKMLDIEKPDLVIHTGDVIFGRPAKESFSEILGVISERNIPFAVTLGNHDEEFGLSRIEALNHIRTIKGCINTPEKGITGATNDVITISDASGKKHAALYLFDSLSMCADIVFNNNGKLDRYYDYIHLDQIQWYRNESLRLRKENGDKPLPALAFMHIPLREHLEAIADKDRRLIGNIREAAAPSHLNSGLFTQVLELGDIQALFSGHEHDNDYVMKWRNRYLIYGRFSGGNTVYNNLPQNGCRMIELTKGVEGFRTYVRPFEGNIEQDLTLPKGL